MARSRSVFFIPAVLYLGLAVSFRIGDGGPRWFWAGQPWVAAVLLAAPGAMWALFFTRVRRQRSRG